jgi:diadenosine hexaphosphate hydrolase (ATP-forming)
MPEETPDQGVRAVAKGIATKLMVTSAGGVVFRGDQVLLLRRPTGQWVFPKGHIDEGEDLLRTALREVEEETGVHARAVAPLGTTSYWVRLPSGQRAHKMVHWFLMEHVAGEPRPEPFFPEASFVPAREALALLSFPQDRELLARALERRAGGRTGAAAT